MPHSWARAGLHIPRVPRTGVTPSAVRTQVAPVLSRIDLIVLWRMRLVDVITVRVVIACALFRGALFRPIPTTCLAMVLCIHLFFQFHVDGCNGSPLQLESHALLHLVGAIGLTAMV